MENPFMARKQHPREWDFASPSPAPMRSGRRWIFSLEITLMAELGQSALCPFQKKKVASHD
jgi:hypothetical protein